MSIKEIKAVKPVAIVPVKAIVPVVKSKLQAAKAMMMGSKPKSKKEKFENSSPYETTFSEGFDQNSNSPITEKFELNNSVNMGVTISVGLVCILGLGYLAFRVAKESKQIKVA